MKVVAARGETDDNWLVHGADADWGKRFPERSRSQDLHPVARREHELQYLFSLASMRSVLSQLWSDSILFAVNVDTRLALSNG